MDNHSELNLEEMSKVAGGQGSYEDDLRAHVIRCIKKIKKDNPNPTLKDAQLLATAKMNPAEYQKIIALVAELYDSVTV